ncbi:hypothetical protein GALL_210030 [mine drainage metagenome]|uniref:PepSY domain-containing protein n=1 Tax=mine drainage metagenome TaxID=410659 RepID=A0A1J5RMI5_9ZZZZ
MTRLRISLEAARIIALTAAIGFVDGNSRIEDNVFSRNRVALVTAAERTASKASPRNGKPELMAGRTAYLIEIRHGAAIREVLVDSDTGRVLLS